MFEAVDLQGKVGNQLFQIVVLPLEVFDLPTGGGSHRVPGEPLFPRFHEACPELAEGSLVQA